MTEMLTIHEVAAWLRVSERTVARLAAAKAIPHVRVGRSLRFGRAELEAWFAGRTARPLATVVAAKTPRERRRQVQGAEDAWEQRLRQPHDRLALTGGATDRYHSGQPTAPCERKGG